MDTTFISSSEAYKPQYNDPFVDELINIIDSSCIYTDNKPEVLTEHFSSSFIALVKKRFGIHIRVLFNNQNNNNCSILVMPIALTSSDPSSNLKLKKIINGLNNNDPETITIKELDKRIKDINNKPDNPAFTKKVDDLVITMLYSSTKALLDKNSKFKNVTVDLKKVYIKNYPISATTILIISRKFLEKDPNLTTREKVAIIIHEIGHIFYSIISSSRTMYNSGIFLDELSILMKTNTNDVNIVMDKYSDYINSLSRSGKNMVSSSKYIYIDNEAFADQLPVRFGLGREIASSLIKVSKLNLKIPNDKLTALSSATNFIDNSNTIVTNIPKSSFFSRIFDTIFGSITRFFTKSKEVISDILSNFTDNITVDGNFTATNGIINSSLSSNIVGEYINLNGPGLKYDTPIRRIERIAIDLRRTLREYEHELSKQEKLHIIEEIEAIEGIINSATKIKLSCKRKDTTTEISDESIYNIVTNTGTDKELVKLMNNSGYSSYEKMKLKLNEKH